MAVGPFIPMTFSQLRQGMVARVTVAPTGKESARLVEMGLTQGTIFRVVKVAPLGDPIEIDLRGYRLCLRRLETQGFEIEPIRD